MWTRIVRYEIKTKELIFSPKKKNKELIFKFKKFSSILCHLRYYCRKIENEHVCTYIYRHRAWALAGHVAPRDAQKQHSKSHLCSSAKSSMLNAYVFL